MTAYIGKFTNIVDYLKRRLTNHHIPWEVSTAATSLVSYAYIMLIVVILATSTACAAVQNGYHPEIAPLQGRVEPIRWSTLLWNVQSAVSGNVRSLLLYNETNKMLMIAWPHSGGVGWIVVDTSMRSFANALHKAGSLGNLVNCADFGCLRNGAELSGYRQITATELGVLAKGFVDSVMAAASGFASNAMPTINIIPVMPSMFAVPGAPVESVQ